MSDFSIRPTEHIFRLFILKKNLSKDRQWHLGPDATFEKLKNRYKCPLLVGNSITYLAYTKTISLVIKWLLQWFFDILKPVLGFFFQRIWQEYPIISYFLGKSLLFFLFFWFPIFLFFLLATCFQWLFWEIYLYLFSFFWVNSSVVLKAASSTFAPWPSNQHIGFFDFYVVL